MITTKKIKPTDIAFMFSLLCIAVLFAFYVQNVPTWEDESFYPTIALRLINGDSLIANEWHLSQFSSIFLYLPVKIWLTIHGSTDSILLFLRCAYLCIHTVGATGIYLFFRKNGIWAIIAALLFYTQTPMNIVNISYNSLFALFLIATGLLLLTIHKKQKPIYYISAGITYACSCVCNPFFCCFFVVCCTICLFLHCRNNLSHKHKNQKTGLLSNKDEVHTIFFEKKAFFLFFCGICIMAIICLIFYFATGGSLSAFSQNFRQLLTDSEHDMFDSPFIAFWYKIKNTAADFNKISYGLFFLPLLLFSALAIDKRRGQTNHKIFYISFIIILSIFYTITIAIRSINRDGNIYFYSFPLFLLSTGCYILTQNKNKILFFCFWIPSIAACFAQYCASNLSFWPIGWTLAIANLAGAFFIKDFLQELNQKKEEYKAAVRILLRVFLCFGICMQISFQCIAVVELYVENNTDETFLLDAGPYENLRIQRRYKGTYQLSLHDLDKIKERSCETDPVLILSDMTWLYLYIDRPFATYSAWQLSFEPDRLQTYFAYNPEKKPKYIYISAALYRSDYGVSFKMAEDKAAVMKSMFNCKEEKLSRGILLTVTE